MSTYQELHDEAEQRVNFSLILNRVIDRLIEDEKRQINRVVGKENHPSIPTTYSSALAKYVALKLTAHRLNRRYSAYDVRHLNWNTLVQLGQDVEIAVEQTKAARKAAMAELEEY